MLHGLKTHCRSIESGDQAFIHALNIDQNTAVAHDCRLGEFSRLNPHVCLSGAVTIGRRALIGANAIVLQELAVGDDEIVGAGAVVTHSVDRATTVMGVPAR